MSTLREGRALVEDSVVVLMGGNSSHKRQANPLQMIVWSVPYQRHLNYKTNSVKQALRLSDLHNSS
jgi:hypothetical protein